jgi:hypothetical protein
LGSWGKQPAKFLGLDLLKRKSRKSPRRPRKRPIASVRIVCFYVGLVLEQEFDEGFGKLVMYVRQDGDRILGLKEFSQRSQLVDFLKRFK